MEHSVKPTKLLNRNFILLWQGQFVSKLGNQAFAIAMMFWIKHETGSASLMGLLLMFSTIPSVLLSPFAGTFADRYPRKKIIVWCDIINGMAVLTLAGLLFLAPENTDLGIVWLFIISVFMSTVSTIFSPAISASIPDLVPEDKVAGANSINQFSMQLSTFLGQGSGGVLFRLLGAPMLFFIDGISYLLSAFSEAFITIPQNIPEKAKDWRDTIRKFKTDTAEGLRYVVHNKGLRVLFFTAAFLNFFLVPVMVLMPFFVEDFLYGTTDWFGYLMAAFGVGAMIGYIIAGAVKLRGKNRAVLVVVSIILMCVGMTAMAYTLNLFGALAIWFGVGILNGFININIATILQLSTPSEIRGRVFGLLTTLSSGLTPIAMGLSGVIADLLHQNIPLLFTLSGAAATLLSIAVSFNRTFRNFLAYEAETTTQN